MHAELHDAIVAGDADRAGAAMTAHVEATRADVRALVAPLAARAPCAFQRGSVPRRCSGSDPETFRAGCRTVRASGMATRGTWRGPFTAVSKLA